MCLLVYCAYFFCQTKFKNNSTSVILFFKQIFYFQLFTHIYPLCTFCKKYTISLTNNNINIFFIIQSKKNSTNLFIRYYTKNYNKLLNIKYFSLTYSHINHLKYKILSKQSKTNLFKKFHIFLFSLLFTTVHASGKQ